MAQQQFEASQSGYRSHHGTETVLGKITNDLLVTSYNRLVSMLVFDLSVAFDTIDHGELLHRLEQMLGIRGTAVKQYKFVHVNNTASKWTQVHHGVPQGSVLGPI